MAITIETLPKGFIGYKASTYEVFNSHITVTEADDSEDWSGLYIAPNKETAIGYTANSIQTDGSGTSYVHEVHLLQECKVLVCDDKIMSDPSTTGEDKAKAFRKQLPATIKPASGSLMPALGLLGYLYKGYHHDKEMEIVVPNKLANLVSMKLTVTCKYKFFELVK